MIFVENILRRDSRHLYTKQCDLNWGLPGRDT